MNLSTWSAIREYIAAEVRLGILRFQRESGQCEAVRAQEIRQLEEQSTRMETAVRKLIEPPVVIHGKCTICGYYSMHARTCPQWQPDSAGEQP